MGYKLLIADDEEMDRMGLNLLFIKEFSDQLDIIEAANGIELVQQFENNDIDIAIVDINMPGINGIDAIKLLRERGCSTKIILNTAYGEFDYAVEALKMHVFDYLLKPMKRDKIIKTINDCIKDLEEERKVKKSFKEQEEIIKNIKPTIANEFIHTIIADNIKFDNISMYSSLLGILPEKGFILTLKIINAEKNDDSINKKIKSTFNSVCTGIINDIEGEIATAFVSLPANLIKHEYFQWAKSFAELLMKKIINECDLKIHIGIGGKVENALELHESYCESIDALKTCGASKIVLYDDICEHNAQNFNNENDSNYSRIISSALDFIHNNYRKDISLEIVADEINVSMFYLSRLFKRELGINFITYLTEYRINQAKTILERGDYTIRQLSRFVGYSNYTYFCKIFKKYTGNTVSEYRKNIMTKND